MLFGVPQGYLLGPQIFIMYTRPTGVIARKYGVKYHLYADETQLYATFDVKDEATLTSSLQALEYCIVEIRSWMAKNMLKLNDDKSDILYVTTLSEVSQYTRNTHW